MRVIDADKLKNNITKRIRTKRSTMEIVRDILPAIDEQATVFDVDDIMDQLQNVAYERFGNSGMGGEMVVNLDDVIEIIGGVVKSDI